MYCGSKDVATSWLTALSKCGYMDLYRRWKHLQVRREQEGRENRPRGVRLGLVSLQRG